MKEAGRRVIMHLTALVILLRGRGARRQKILDDASMREERQRLFRRIMTDAGAQRKRNLLVTNEEGKEEDRNASGRGK